MAVLILLALIGLGMMVATRGERLKLTPQREALALDAAMDRAVLLVRERLRDDLLVDPNHIRVPPNGSNPFDPGNPDHLAEILARDPNDPTGPGLPYDAPGPSDRWLASTTPFYDTALGALRWVRVSYFGPIHNEPVAGANPNGLNDDPNDPNHSDLRRLPLLDPNQSALSAIPAWSPAEGRRIFARPRGSVPGIPAAFWDKYRDLYDVDGNGVLDLYDADGDGVPDSPISLTLPVETPTPTDQPKRVHAVIRVIDNGSMVNVNTASSFFWPADPIQLRTAKRTFPLSPNDPDRQLRGRRVCEVVFDQLYGPVHGFDTFESQGSGYGSRTARLVGGRFNQTLPPPFTYYQGYYRDVIRRQLIGGLPVSGHTYLPYGWRDEASLRHRFSLVPYGLRLLGSALPSWDPQPPTEWEGQIDSDLFRTLCWSGVWDDDAGHHTWNQQHPEWRWRRLDGALPPTRVNDLFNGEDRDTSCCVRRPYFTTFNAVSDRRLPNKRLLSTLGAPGHDYTIFIGGEDRPRPLMRPGGAANCSYTPGYGMIGGEKVCLNAITDHAGVADPNAPFDYVAQLAWAFYVSGAVAAPDPNHQNDPCSAWQAAVNIYDYRDADDVPTVVKDGTNIIAVGLERQPFLTEVHIVIDPNDPNNNKVLAEVYNPYPVDMPETDANWGFKVQMTGQTSPLKISVPKFGWTALNLTPTDPNVVGTMDPNTVVVELLREIPDANDVVVDRFRLAGADFVEPAVPAFGTNNNWQRNDKHWKFTIAKSVFDPNTTGTLGAANNVEPNSIEPSQWVFRNRGTRANEPNDTRWWTFDTPGELSRVMMWANGGTIPVTERLAMVQAAIEKTNPGNPENPMLKRAAGRLDFFRTPAWVEANRADPRDIFGYVTCVSARHDNIDNDGNGLVDEPNEAEAVNYLHVGQINVNTAPLRVLYTVPYMVAPFLSSLYGLPEGGWWDVAAGIVARREGRCVTSLELGQTVGDPNWVPPRVFTGLGDLAEVVSGTERRYTVNRFGLGDPGPPHGAAAPWSPDYDATDPNAGAPTLTDAHDGLTGVPGDLRKRDVLLARWGNILTVRSDVYTVYVALIDDDGRYLRRCQFTLDRTNSLRDPRQLPVVFGRVDTNYYDDTR